jgi:signal transduction histidine kinase
MKAVARNSIAAGRNPLLGVGDVSVARCLAAEIERLARPGRVVFASNLADLLEWARRIIPRVILIDSDLLGKTPLDDFLREFETKPAVILLAPPERQADFAQLVAAGSVEFVARAGNFIPLAAALVERRLRWAASSECPLGPPWAEFRADLGSIFRHEINNPLTGILGNAELLLAHRDRLSPVDTQRLQTVVDLAVRLRETTRRLSNAWEHARSLESA